MDVQRSLALWREFEAPQSLIRRGDWVDQPSVNIPALYVMSGYFLSEGLMGAGERPQADSVLRTATEVAAAAHLDQMFRPPPPQALPLPGPGDTSRSAPIPSGAQAPQAPGSRRPSGAGTTPPRK